MGIGINMALSGELFQLNSVRKVYRHKQALDHVIAHVSENQGRNPY